MSWFLRMAMTIPKAYLSPKITKIGEIEQKSFQVLPTDIDVFGHMNNSQYFVCMEMMRWDYTVRLGFATYAAKKKIAMPIAAQTISYLKPLRAFQKFVVTGQIVYYGDKYFVWEHYFRSGDKVCAHAMMKGVLRGPKGPVPTAELFADMGLEPMNKPMPEKVEKWLSAVASMKD